MLSGYRLPWLCISIVLLATSSVRSERFPVRTYTSADGLGSSFVNDLMRDSRGFLWICTRDGLSRFDGSRFVTYQIGDNAAPPGIEQILETRAGVYWISTTGGLFRFDPNASLTVPESKTRDRATLKAEFVSDARGVLFEDHVGNLWLGSSDLYRVLEKDNKRVFEKVELNLPINPSNRTGIAAIAEGQDSSFWVLTPLGVSRRFADGKQVFYGVDDPRANALTSMMAARDGRIWVGRQKGVYVIQPESREELSFPGPVLIRDLNKIAREGSYEDHLTLPQKPGEILRYSDAQSVSSGYGKYFYQTADGHIWISSTKSLIDFDGRTFHVYTSAQGFNVDITHLVEDGNANLWLGGPNGLVRWDRSGLTSYLAADGLSKDNPYILVSNRTRDGQLYVMSNDLSVSLFDGKSFQTIRPQLPRDAHVLWSSNPAFQDSEGEWWFLTDGKLFRFAATKEFRELASQRPLVTYDSRDGLSGDQMFHIFEDSHHDLWISTHDSQHSGLSRWSRASNKFHAFTEAEGFPANRAPSSFAEDARGDTFFGFYEGGLLRYTNGQFTQFTPADGLPGGLITALHLDRQGRLWIGSAQSGLSRVDEPSAIHPRFLSFSVENGLTSNNVRSITEDLYGNIYAGTARGIDRLSADGTRIKHYSVSDGLAGDFVVTAMRDGGGSLWFGTPNGLSRLVPRQDKSLTPPPVWISGLRIAGERRAVSELGSIEIPLLELTQSQNNLQIDFFGIDFDTGSLRYQYMLEGADRDWGQLTQQRSVNYANLAPGAYRFLARAVNADGVISLHPAVVSFRILPPIWRRWWFLALAALFIGGFVLALDRYRVARMKELNAALGESKIAEQAARESEERFRTLAETASDAIITIDEDSRIRFVNPATEQVFGYGSQELMGADLAMLMPEYLRHLHQAGFGRYVRTGKKHLSWHAIELPGLHKSGREIPLELSFGEFTRDERRYFTGIVRDISERKRAEEALQHAREERMRELERVRKRIASDLHDDIGSSLTQISLLSEVAQQGLGNEGSALTEPLAMIANSSRELVDSMSDIVWAINPQKDHLSDLSQRMRTLASDVFTASNIKFKFETPEDGDELRIGANLRREVFMIFKESINNIAKHSRCTSAHIEFRLNDRVLFLSVSDDGCGFDTTEDNEGHGLVSMRERSRAMGGSLEMVSKAGRGTTITLQVQLGAQTVE